MRSPSLRSVPVVSAVVLAASIVVLVLTLLHVSERDRYYNRWYQSEGTVVHIVSASCPPTGARCRADVVLHFDDPEQDLPAVFLVRRADLHAYANPAADPGFEAWRLHQGAEASAVQPETAVGGRVVAYLLALGSFLIGLTALLGLIRSLRAVRFRRGMAESDEAAQRADVLGRRRAATSYAVRGLLAFALILAFAGFVAAHRLPTQAPPPVLPAPLSSSP